MFPCQQPGPGPQPFAADLQLLFAVGQLQLQFFPVRQHVVPGDIVGKTGAPGLHEAEILPAGGAQIDQGGRQRQTLQGILGKAVAATGQRGHQQRTFQQQAGKPHAPEAVRLAVVELIGQVPDLFRRTAAQLAQAVLAQKIVKGRGLQAGQRLGQGQGCGRPAGKIAGRGLGRLVGIGIGDAFGDRGHGVGNLMAKRWRQYPGACGPTPEAQPARHPPPRRDGGCRYGPAGRQGHGHNGRRQRRQDREATDTAAPLPGTGRAHDNRKGVGQQWPTPWGSVIRGTD